MTGFACRAVLASLSLMILSLWTQASAQAPDASPARKRPLDVFNHIDGESTVIKRQPAGNSW